MAFSGVRSSWLKFARNCVFARFACSAAQLRPMQFLLAVVRFRHVVLDGDDMADTAAGVADRGDPVLGPVDTAILASVAEQAVPDPAAAHRSPQLRIGLAGSQARLQEAGRPAQDLVAAPAGNAAEMGIGIFDRAVRACDQDAHRRMLHRQLELAPLSFRGFAPAQRADYREEPGGAGAGNTTEAGFHRKEAAIAAPAEAFGRSAALAAPGQGRQPAPDIGLRRHRLVREQVGRGAAGKLALGIAEQPLRGTVRGEDPAALLYADRGFRQPPQRQLRFAAARPSRSLVHCLFSLFHPVVTRGSSPADCPPDEAAPWKS